MSKQQNRILVIGAGPAGLGSAYELLAKNTKAAVNKVTLIEKNSSVGGLARSISFKSFRFDVGPHRFYTKNKEVKKLWEQTLGSEFIKVRRTTRILYKNKLFSYPIQIREVFTKLSPLESLESLQSYLFSKIFLRSMIPNTFEEWITKQFGSKLYKVFFKTYTEKIWGIPCNQIGAEWAAQRIKNLNFSEIIKNALSKTSNTKHKSLIESFYYPIKGSGFMYETLASKLQKKGAELELNSTVVSIQHHNGKIISVTFKKNGQLLTTKVDALFSSMPLTHFINCLNPKPPQLITTASNKLFYRDHLTVNLIVNSEQLFPDNWIYVHSPSVKMARITNYNNFLPNKLRPSKYTPLSVEYFAFRNDKLWKLSDKKLISLALSELKKVHLLTTEKLIDAFVIRETEAYPTYYLGHKEYFDKIKAYTENFSNLYLIGRGGMYKYNNMDHSIYSGVLAARNFVLNETRFDTWKINEDAQYLETK